MAGKRTTEGLWRPIKAVLRFPAKVVGGVMAAMGRAYNSTYYPGAGGGVVDDAAIGAGRRKPRRRVRRRSR